MQRRNLAPRKLFLTVGTTEFDELVRAVDTLSFMQCLKELGINELTLQIGRGVYEPSVMAEIGVSMGIQINVYRFKPTLDEDVKNADMIISHCGAGSILEAVRYKKELIVVVNDSLQDNHQTELSDAMSAGGYCTSTKPNRLCEALMNVRHNVQNEEAIFIPINDANLFQSAILGMFDFT